MKVNKRFAFPFIFIFLLLSVLCVNIVGSNEASEVPNEGKEGISYFDELHPDTFKKVNDNKGLFVVYFGSNDCEGCEEVTPMIIEASKELSYIPFYYIEGYEEVNKSLIKEYGVTFIPTLIVFDNGIVKERLNGFDVSEQQLKKIIAGE